VSEIAGERIAPTHDARFRASWAQRGYFGSGVGRYDRRSLIAAGSNHAFVGNPEGVIKVAEIHDLGIGRDAKELLRKVQAAQYVAEHPGEVCPAKWTPGQKTLAPSLDLVGKT
jgi:alkyl hydroperoxide reductase subunit AhpC